MPAARVAPGRTGVSFIVPAFNEQELLEATLRAVHAAARSLDERYEIVVADDASTDRTAAVAARLGARVERVEHRQISATRNSGARAARGDVLVFVDADTIVNPAVVGAALAACREGGAVGGGATVELDEPLPRYARALMPLLTWTFRIARWAPGCFLFCTREAFDAVGGFDEALFGGEEIRISRELKRRGRFVVLREAVTSSGRKLRAHSGWKVLRVLGGLALRPWRLRGRRGLELWYEERRDPKPSGG